MIMDHKKHLLSIGIAAAFLLASVGKKATASTMLGAKVASASMVQEAFGESVTMQATIDFFSHTDVE